MTSAASAHVPLEPLSTGDIIDRSIRLYRQNLRALLLTAAGPFLLGATAWLALTLGWQIILPTGASPSAAAGAGAAILLAAGFIAYLAYIYVMVLVYAGLARVIGDHLMLGEPITARAVWRSIRLRIVDLSVTALLLFAGGLVIGAILATVLFVAMMILMFVVAILAAAGASFLPEWLVGILLVLVILVTFGGIALVLLPLMLSRVIFVPQVVIIEGASAGAAFGRAFSLGTRNWYRVLAVLLFTYCTGFSMTLAVMLPFVVALWLGGFLSADSLVLVDSIYGAAGQFANFLSVPAWAIAYTLMYFDSRVRAEGYDIALLVRQLPRPQRPMPSIATAPVTAFAGSAYAKAIGGRCPRCSSFLLTNPNACSACGWRGIA